MRAPKVHRLGDTITMNFHEAMVHATLEHPRDVRGDLWAEVTLRSSAPAVTPHLHRSRLNLASLTQRDHLARMLRRRFPVEGVDWAEIVEQVAVTGLDLFRAGEPVVMVGRLDRAPGPRYLVEPLLLAGELNMLYGAGGTGKTTLAVALALTAQERASILGLEPPSEPSGTLFLDFEQSAEAIDGLVKRLAAGAGLPTVPEVAYRRCVGALADQVEGLRRLIAEQRARFVIVDSAGAACGGEPESAEVVLRLTNGIRALETTALLIDHLPKAGEEPFGSVYKVNAARMVWRVRRQQEVGEDEIRLGLFNTKSNLSRKHRPMGWRLRFDNTTEAATFSRTDPAEVEEFRSGLSAREQVCTYLLGAGSATARVVTDATGLPYNTVRETLKRMEARQEAVRLPKEGEREVYWGLPDVRHDTL